MNSKALESPRLGVSLRFKWWFFQLLESLSDLRGNKAKSQFELSATTVTQDALWVFASTIGELNAIDPWLRQLTERMPDQRLVLITDHKHYRDSYEARYPKAVVCVSHGHGRDARALAKIYRPKLLVVAEIPCLPSDAPCRFSSSFVLEAKRHGAVAMIVNGWLYGYSPACTMDHIERRLFERDFVRSFDMICVQTQDIADRLVAGGAKPHHISVCGNIKFDAMGRGQWKPEQARSVLLLQGLLAAARPVVVAGCVTSDAEQRAVLDAFVQLQTSHADVLLVLAPRHPEVAERMLSLRRLLSERNLTASFRSELGMNQLLPPKSDCLVLDTIGDLRDFYACATVAHVGVDHNLLEPLSFDRPVTVMPGWEPTYPSYPVFQILNDGAALRIATDAQGLSQHWREVLDGGPSNTESLKRSLTALSNARGAVERHFAAVLPWLEHSA